MPVDLEDLAHELAVVARRLNIGMLDRVKRLPDIADYEVAFNRVLRRNDVASEQRDNSEHSPNR